MEKVCAECGHDEVSEFKTHYRCCNCGHRMEKGVLHTPVSISLKHASNVHSKRQPSLPKLKFLEDKE